MSEATSVLWVHGYADAPDGAMATAAGIVAAELGITLIVPELTITRNGYRINVPISEQVAMLQPALKQKPNIVCHSQGAIVGALGLARALAMDPSLSTHGQQLTLLAPSLASSHERLKKQFTDEVPNELEHALARAYGGVHRVIPPMFGMSPIIDTKEYYAEVLELEHQPVQYVADFLRCFDEPRIIRPANDIRLGHQRDEYDQLEQASNVRIETVPHAYHFFTRIEECIARAALSGCSATDLIAASAAVTAH